MNATERARRSDSLYYDTQVTDRRALCDMIANLESDLEDAKVESAKLQASNEVIAEDHAALCEQNAKLRELCTDIWHLFTEHGAVHPCDLPVVDAVRERMHKLGIEV